MKTRLGSTLTVFLAPIPLHIPRTWESLGSAGGEIALLWHSILLLISTLAFAQVYFFNYPALSATLQLTYGIFDRNTPRRCFGLDQRREGRGWTHRYARRRRPRERDGTCGRHHRWDYNVCLPSSIIYWDPILNSR